MKRVRTLGTGVSRASARALLIPNVTWALLAVTYPAHAELAAPFQDTLTVDSEYANGVSGATDIAFSADGRAVITRKNGQVVIRRANGTTNVLPASLFGSVSSLGEQGLLGVVADPNVAENKAFYFYVTITGGEGGSEHRVLKAVLTDQDTLTVDPMPIIAAARNNGPPLTAPDNHNGGGMAIHKGQLYVGVGDTGANSTPPSNKFGSCLNNPHGKILRVNLDGSVPTDNPLVGKSDVTACTTRTGSWSTGAPDTRIFAWGFRNPWRLWFDSQTDLMWVGDVGETTSEEISAGKGGQHYGFPFVEGSKSYGDVAGKNCSTMSPGVPCTPPVHTYPRGEGGGKGSITGGLIPSGCGWEKALGGTFFLFGDFEKNWVRAVPVNAQRNGVPEVDGAPAKSVNFDVFSSSTGPVSFRMGPDESLYIVYYSAAAVYRYTPTDRTGCEPSGTAGSGAGGASTAGAPAGGAAQGGAAGGATTGGTPSGGTAGAVATAGTPGMTAGAAGTTPNGGSSSGVSGSGTIGGAPGLGGASPGTAGAPAAGAPAGGGSKDDGGCGCRVAGGNAGIALSALLVAGTAAGAWRRRRRRDSGR